MSHVCGEKRDAGHFSSFLLLKGDATHFSSILLLKRAAASFLGPLSRLPVGRRRFTSLAARGTSSPRPGSRGRCTARPVGRGPRRDRRGPAAGWPSCELSSPRSP